MLNKHHRLFCRRGTIIKKHEQQGYNMAEPIITMSSVTKTYKRGRQDVKGLDDVSLQVREGEFVAITGASGSGKSTLLQIIGGLDRPNTGAVIVHKVDIATLSDGKLSEFRNTTIGFVFQFFYLQPFLNLSKNMELPSMFAGTRRRARRQEATRLLEQVGLADRTTHYPHELSGGQIQRAAIARALINNPKIILADEPTGNLDKANSREIINLLKEVCRTYGTTVIIVTHDPEVASQADREITLSDGAIV
ncbi:Macrolide export ATP-binding/permease protein MacB [compost metagenome]